MSTPYHSRLKLRMYLYAVTLLKQRSQICYIMAMALLAKLKGDMVCLNWSGRTWGLSLSGANLHSDPSRSSESRYNNKRDLVCVIIHGCWMATCSMCVMVRCLHTFMSTLMLMKVCAWSCDQKCLLLWKKRKKLKCIIYYTDETLFLIFFSCTFIWNLMY